MKQRTNETKVAVFSKRKFESRVASVRKGEDGEPWVACCVTRASLVISVQDWATLVDDEQSGGCGQRLNAEGTIQ